MGTILDRAAFNQVGPSLPTKSPVSVLVSSLNCNVTATYSQASTQP